MVDAREQRLGELLAISIRHLPPEDALDLIGELIDLAGDLDRQDGIELSLEWCEALHRLNLEPRLWATLHYFQANALATAIRLRGGASSNWDQPEVENEIIQLRQALKIGTEHGLDIHRLSQVLTNLGNLLSGYGRVVEALEYWDRSLVLNPPHGMTIGNRGYGLIHYAATVHQPGHQLSLLREAHRCLIQALGLPLHDGAHEVFLEARRWLEDQVPSQLLEPRPMKEVKVPGRSRGERSYRSWCDEMRLFLCSRNDLGAKQSSYRDCLFLPGIRQPIASGPHYIGFFNQIKQEFIAARLLFYEGVTSFKIHFADRLVTLADTLDYPAYSISVERTKAAFRLTYSIFDKIAFFLNDYLKLGIPANQVTFKTLWYEQQGKKRVARGAARRHANRPLLGLFWVAKDLQESAPGFTAAMEPELQYLADVRNHLEHRYLKLHVEHWIRPEPGFGAIEDTLAYHLDRTSFEQKTLRLLKLARASLIYLCAAVYLEEGRRDKEDPPGDRVFDSELPLMRDEWRL